jgi:hypothetical protein
MAGKDAQYRIRTMRRLLVLVLCLLMPLQGFAALQVVNVPCPMQAGMSMSVDMGDIGDLADAMEDCCNDAATFERTGEVCKPGQVLHAPVAWMPPFFPLESQEPAAQSLREPAWRMHPPGQPTPLWRPPTPV